MSTSVPTTTSVPVPGVSQPGTGPGRRTVQPTRAGRRPIWLLAPGAVLMVVVILVPFVFGVYFSVVDLNQYNLRRWVEAPFVGVTNFVEVFSRSTLLSATGRSVVFGVATTVLTLPVGLAAALATHTAFRGRSLVRSLFLVPYVLPSFVVATVWRTMLRPDGIVNSLLERVGVDGGLWLTGPKALLTLILVDTWAAWPFIYLMALAGLQTIEREVHEASALDGATWQQKLRYVVLPQIKGPVALGCLIATLHHINNFTLPFVLFGLPAPRDIEVLPVLTYQTSFVSFRFGLGAAMAIVSLVLILIPLLFYLRAVRLDSGDEGGRR